jgi:hypothetical protein
MPIIGMVTDLAILTPAEKHLQHLQNSHFEFFDHQSLTK